LCECKIGESENCLVYHAICHVVNSYHPTVPSRGEKYRNISE
jgi:hypothetical protein